MTTSVTQVSPAAAPTMYVAHEGHMYVLRQERYRANRGSGYDHPHDVCAVATSAQELHEMVMPHWPDADFSAVASELKPK